MATPAPSTIALPAETLQRLISMAEELDELAQPSQIAESSNLIHKIERAFHELKPIGSDLAPIEIVTLFPGQRPVDETDRRLTQLGGVDTGAIQLAQEKMSSWIQEHNTFSSTIHTTGLKIVSFLRDMPGRDGIPYQTMRKEDINELHQSMKHPLLSESPNSVVSPAKETDFDVAKELFDSVGAYRFVITQMLAELGSIFQIANSSGFPQWLMDYRVPLVNGDSIFNSEGTAQYTLAAPTEVAISSTLEISDSEALFIRPRWSRMQALVQSLVTMHKTYVKLQTKHLGFLNAMIHIYTRRAMNEQVQLRVLPEADSNADFGCAQLLQFLESLSE